MKQRVSRLTVFLKEKSSVISFYQLVVQSFRLCHRLVVGVDLHANINLTEPPLWSAMSMGKLTNCIIFVSEKVASF